MTAVTAYLLPGIAVIAVTTVTSFVAQVGYCLFPRIPSLLDPVQFLHDRLCKDTALIFVEMHTVPPFRFLHGEYYSILTCFDIVKNYLVFFDIFLLQYRFDMLQLVRKEGLETCLQEKESVFSDEETR